VQEKPIKLHLQAITNCISRVSGYNNARYFSPTGKFVFIAEIVGTHILDILH
jgi:hypothetical protein